MYFLENRSTVGFVVDVERGAVARYQNGVWTVVGKVAQAVPSLRWVADVYCYNAQSYRSTTRLRVAAKQLPFVPEHVLH